MLCTHVWFIYVKCAYFCVHTYVCVCVYVLCSCVFVSHHLATIFFMGELPTGYGMSVHVDDHGVA